MTSQAVTKHTVQLPNGFTKKGVHTVGHKNCTLVGFAIT